MLNPRPTWTRTRAAQELDEIARLGAEIEQRFTALYHNSSEALRDQYNSSDEFGLDLDGLRRRAREMAADLREADRRQLLTATAEAGYLQPRDYVEAVTSKPGWDNRGLEVPSYPMSRGGSGLSNTAAADLCFWFLCLLIFVATPVWMVIA